MEESDAEKIATLEEALRSAQDELSEERAESRRAKESEFDLQQRLKAVEAELENSRLRAEIEMLRAVEKAREEERKCSQSWANDLRERFRIEKKVLEEKVASLEAGSSSEATRAPVGGSSPGTTDAGTLASGDTSSVTPVSTAATSDSTAATSDSTAATSDSTATRTTISTVTSAPGLTVASAGATGTATTTSPSASTTLTTAGSAVPIASMGSAEMIVKLFESQSQLLAAQVQAASLPPLATFEGQPEVDGVEFEQWLERFEERARLTRWTEDTKLCQLRAHLSKVAGQVFQMLAKDEKSSYARAISVLKDRFRSVEIEELKGLEFHRRVQTDESIERLGMDLQKLGRKAFPSTGGKDFDRLLKGRFYQALHPRWQRKLNAPRADESFAQLYERARMLEQHEKQFTASAAYRSEPSTKRNRPSPPVSSPSAPVTNKPIGTTPRPGSNAVRLCHSCHQPGHFARNCPARSRERRQEAPGRAPSTVSHVEVVDNGPKEFSEEELEHMLSQCRLHKEKQKMKETTTTPDGAVAHVNAASQVGRTIGPLLYKDVTIEGMPVVAMVDCGSQTTIISRSLLHRIARKLQEEGKPLPELKIPSVRLYGKDGPNGRSQLPISAEVELRIEANGETVTVPMFVQPNSAQACLLGTNATVPLKFRFLDGSGKPLRTTHDPGPEPRPATVSLIQAVTIPSRKCCFLRAKVSGERSLGEELLFQPKGSLINSVGGSTMDSLVTLLEGDTLLVPFQNFEKHSVDLPAGVELGVVEPFDENVSIPQDGTCARVLVDGPGCYDKTRSGRLVELLDLSKSDCSLEELSQLKAMLCQQTDIFEMDRSELGHSSVVKHMIDTGDSMPVRQQPYRTPMVQRERIAQLIQQMQEQGVVKPSCSPWASPIVLVPKRDGSTRFCVDYRRLNSVTKKDVYPLPHIQDILDTLGQAKCFTTLDLSSGYWQVELDTESRAKTAFTSHCGLFEFTRMPFGLCNAPATFQRLMQVVLAGLEWDFCFVYVDDILVASKSFDEHLLHLKLVFERLRQAGLRLKPTKCNFLRAEVPYLGYVISKTGIRPDPAKTDKVRNFPTPTDPTSVRSFVGLASYYRRFVPQFASVAAPLHRLTKKDVAFEWSSECEAAFSKLKSLLTEAPVLVYPRFGKGEHFLLETDASGVGLGAVLSQQQSDGRYHPIAYASRSLQPSEKNYAISELETLAIVWAVKYFRPYLLGYPCTVLTDHAACVSLLNTPRPSSKLARWAMTLQEMDLSIKHRSGHTNASADALSRFPVDTATVSAVTAGADSSLSEPATEIVSDASCLLELSESTRQKLDKLADLQKSCPELRDQFLYLTEEGLPEDEKACRKIVAESRYFDIVDGVLHHESPHFPGRWCVAVPVDMRQSLMEDAHSGLLAGHLAEKRVYDRLRRAYWWKGMRRDVRKHCRSCLACGTRKGTGRASHPPLQPIPVSGPFSCVGVDILKLPQTYDGNQYVVVFVDYLTKWVEAFPTADQKAETIAKLLVEQVICRHGAPERLLSDRGANFLSDLIAEVCRLLKIQKINTSGYHPQTDGLVERFHQTLIQMLSLYVEKHGRDWDQYLPFLLYAYRVSLQESVRESPFFLLYGRDPRQPIDEALCCPTTRLSCAIDSEDYRSELVRGLSDAWKAAAQCVTTAQAKQKRVYDRRAKHVDYRVGDRVLVHMPHEATGKAAKLARPFFGPYRVLGVTSTNAEVRLVDKPDDPPIFVSLGRIRPCYEEIPDVSWSGHSPRKRRRKRVTVVSPVERVDTSPPERVNHRYPTRSRDGTIPAKGCN